MRRALWAVVPAAAVLAVMAGRGGTDPHPAARIVRARTAPPPPSEATPRREQRIEAPPARREPILAVEPPRPPSEAADDWRNLRRWLLDGLTDVEFARLLLGTEIETYFARVAAGLLEGPRPDYEAFLDRFNRRVIVCERLDVSSLEDVR